MSQQSRQQKEILNNLQKNQFIPKETLEQFISKQKGERPAKKIFFEKQPGTHDRKTLLNEYLESMKERELKKL